MTLDTPLVGGGGWQGCGGKRPNAGRKSTIKSQVDWKMYKKIGKKESQDLKKKHKSIDLFFTKASKDSIDSSNQIDDAVPVKVNTPKEEEFIEDANEIVDTAMGKDEMLNISDPLVEAIGRNSHIFEKNKIP